MPKKVEVKVSKLEGSPLAERGKFAQAYEYIPPEEDLRKRRGRLFVTLDIKADPVFDVALAGKLVWDSLSEEYFAESDDPPLKVLERAVLLAKNRLVNLAHPSESSADEFGSRTSITLNLAAAVLWEGPVGSAGEGGVLYLIRQGSPSIFLRRAGHVRKPLEGEEPISIASVVIESGDVVFLGSHDFGKNFTPATLPEVSFFEKEFARGRQVSGLAATILKLKVSEEAVQEEVLPHSQSSDQDSAKQEEAPFTPGRKLSLPSPAKALKRLSKREKKPSLPSGKTENVASLRSLLSPSANVWSSAAPGAVWHSVMSAGATLSTQVGMKAKEGAKRLGRAAQEKIDARISRGREVYLHKKRPAVGLSKVIAALVLIFLFSTTFTLWRQRQRVRAEELACLFTSVEESLDEAEDLAGFSAERAKEFWREAQGELEEAATMDSNDKRLASLTQRLETVYNLIEKVTLVTEDNLFYDLISQGGWIRALALTGGADAIYVVDEGTGATLAVRKEIPDNISRVEEATANEVKEARRLGREGSYLYLLNDENFWRYHLNSGGGETPLAFDRLSAVTSFDTYNGNVYLLVPSENQVYKFLDLGTEYSRALSWLKEPNVLEGAVDLAIDGSIWILAQDGTVMKFLAGKREPFSVTGLTLGIAQPKAIYTRPAFGCLYIAEGDPASPNGSQGGRVLMVNKDGQFERQFKSDILADLVDLWVTDDEKTLYILTTSKIFKVSL